MKTLKPTECSVLASSNTVFVDVDDTLIMWDVGHKIERSILIRDPHLAGESVRVIPHRTHINILKRNHAQGRTIIVWSAAGYEWACQVISHLGLEKYVTLIIPKPVCYVDDKPMSDWGCMRTYLKRDIEGEKENE